MKQSGKKDLPLWNLKDLLARPEADFKDLCQQLEKQVSEFEALRPRLEPALTIEIFSNTLHLAENTAAVSSKLSAYAFLWFAENTKHQQARAFSDQVKERITGFANRVLFFDLWWQHLDDTNAARLLLASGDYRYHLESLRRLKDHALSEPEERIINLKNSTGCRAIDNLYDVLTNGFSFRLKTNGKTHTLTREELSSHFRSPSAKIRKAAYQELYRVYSANRDVIGEIYKTLLSDWKNEGLVLRHYRSSIGVRNLSNDIPDEAVQALLSVCQTNAPVFQEYFRIKARLCRIKPMMRYHLYAPARVPSIHYPYQQAAQLVLDAYRQFSPTLADSATKVFADRHIDARLAPGKMGGAFCYSVLPKLTPYVLINYTGEARDVATLAHELGHAVHGMMAKDHSVFTFHSTLPLAETASVFGEQLLSEALLNQESNRRIKQSLLLAQLDDLYATILRQAYFVEFENHAHDMVANGATVDQLADRYLGLLRQQFGKAVTVTDEFKWEWLTIPHIFGSPFYCYAYSFGNLLVLALYHKYKEQGSSFVPRYLELLATGGSKSPEAMLTPLGIDIRSESFWQAGFDRISEMVKNLERTL